MNSQLEYIRKEVRLFDAGWRMWTPEMVDYMRSEQRRLTIQEAVDYQDMLATIAANRPEIKVRPGAGVLLPMGIDEYIEPGTRRIVDAASTPEHRHISNNTFSF